MSNAFGKIDFAVLAGLIVLVAIGILLILPYSRELARQQVVFALVGFASLFAVSFLDHQVLKGFAPHLYVVSVVILLGLNVFGEEVRGATRSFSLARLHFQPSEFLKPFIIIAFAAFIDEVDFSRTRSVLKVFGLILLPVILIFLQPDLGNAVIYFLVGAVILVVAGLPGVLMAGGAAAIIGAIPVFGLLLRDYQRRRLLGFLHPGLDPLGAGYHTVQALIAVGSGQLTGKGIGRGTQSRLQFLPEQHNDFIFATLAEEMGLIGVTLVLGVFFFVFWRLIKVAVQAPDRYGGLLAAGLTAQLLFQMFINGGMNMALLPVTGVNLPYLSYGGSSLVGSLISVGLIQAVRRRRIEVDIDRIG
jgi:rod shape determining protein RodA